MDERVQGDRKPPGKDVKAPKAQKMFQGNRKTLLEPHFLHKHWC